jgi:ATP-dependent Clp protease ATP-binding subunit ClpC
MFRRLFGGGKKHPIERKERFTQCARRVIASSEQAAKEFQDSSIRAEHMLMGMIRENESTAHYVLTALNISLDTLERALREMSRPIATNKPDVALAPDVKRMLEMAVDETRRRFQLSIGTEHLLLAMMRQGHTVAFQALAQFGVTPQMVRDKVREVAAQMQETLPPSSDPE